MKKKVLIADDNEGILDALKIMMENAGYSVEAVSDGKQVLKKKETLPDIFLLDARLPGIDGREICRRLKADERTRNIPVIIISASHELERTSREAGAEDFISKPFSMRELLAKVAKYTN